MGEFTEKIALLRANDDEGLEDEYSVRREGGRERGREGGRERVGREGRKERGREGESGREKGREGACVCERVGVH